MRSVLSGTPPPRRVVTVWRAVLATASSASFVCIERGASAQSTIREPGERTSYEVELEPHMSVGLFDPPGRGPGDLGFGAGARVSLEIVHEGFVRTINDSVAIGLGADFLHYAGNGMAGRGECTRFVPGPAGTSVCVAVAQAGGPSSYVFFPVVMQWNFWLTRRWSTFGEPGLSVYWSNTNGTGVTPVIDVGGRLHLSDAVALTMRIGYPALTLGASFLF